MEHKQISKGIYQHSQIGNFISVKNYIFIRKDGKKHLMLRFSNDFGYAVSSITYVIVQTDSAGKTIARTKITHGGLDFQPGSTYAAEDPICVDEYCSDFRIEFSEVVSGFYRYEVRSDMITVHYIKVPEPITGFSELGRREQRKYRDEVVSDYRMGQKKYQERGVAAFVAVIISIVMLGLNVLNMYLIYFASEKPDFPENLPFVGGILEALNTVCSKVSSVLNFLTYTEGFLILFFSLIAFAVIALLIIRAHFRKSAR